MNQIHGKCVICTSILASDDIAALHCGHTFHFPCISEWIERSETCPICGATTAESHIVNLYFDNAADPNASQVESLSVPRLKSVLDEFVKLVEAAMEYFGEKIPSLEARNRQLEMMLVDQQELQEDLERTQNRLRACELQLYEVRKTEQKLKDELKVERESVSTLKKEEHDLKNKVAILAKELQDICGTANIGSTPFNPTPRSLALDQSFQQKIFNLSIRVSLGFNESVELYADVLRKEKGEKVYSVQFEVKEQETRPGTILVPKPLFVALLNDEDEVEAATWPSPPIPKNMRERLPSGCGSKSNRPMGFGAVQGAAAKALPSLENRNGSTDMISRKPGLKQRLNQNDLDNQRLSVFPKKKSLRYDHYDDKSALL